MSCKVAFASSDGKIVNQHFGGTKKFLIVEIEDGKAKYIETRENVPPCNNYEHSEDAMGRSVSLLQDCKAVFVAKIGQGAYSRLKENGTKAIEMPHFIEDIIEKLEKLEIEL